MIHVALSKAVNLPRICEQVFKRESPGHVLIDLGQRMELKTHEPATAGTAVRGGLQRRLYGLPQHWDLAERISTLSNEGDVILSTGEDVGIPLGATLAATRDRAKHVVFAHNIDRPRAKLAMRWLRVGRGVDLWLTNARPQYEFLARAFGESSVRMVPEQTDTEFFTPGPGNRVKERPLIAAVGLEQRDYLTLAEATASLNVDVRISAFSRDATVIRELFPDPLPANMECRFYAWPELVQLYRDADLVVVPLVENRFCAGLTAILEALACKRPVVATRTVGLSSYFEEGIAYAVPPNHPAALRTGILHLLENPHVAESIAAKGHAWVREGHTPRHWVDCIAGLLGELEGAGESRKQKVEG